ITRAEEQLIARHAAELLATTPGLDRVVELGSGSGEKLARLLAALPDGGAGLTAHLVHISPRALELSRRTLGALGGLRVVTHAMTYEAGLDAALAARDGDGAALVLFLGSNLGNLDAAASAAFLQVIRRRLRPGDALLLGADLVKPEAEL